MLLLQAITIHSSAEENCQPVGELHPKTTNIFPFTSVKCYMPNVFTILRDGNEGQSIKNMT